MSFGKRRVFSEDLKKEAVQLDVEETPQKKPCKNRDILESTKTECYPIFGLNH